MSRFILKLSLDVFVHNPGSEVGSPHVTRTLAGREVGRMWRHAKRKGEAFKSGNNVLKYHMVMSLGGRLKPKKVLLRTTISHPTIYAPHHISVNSVSITAQLDPDLRAPFARFGSDAGDVETTEHDNVGIIRSAPVSRVGRAAMERGWSSHTPEPIVTCERLLVVKIDAIDRIQPVYTECVSWRNRTQLFRRESY
jgi:hypothetical protein